MTPTDPFDVLNIINSPKNKHSTGHDNISTSFLKDIKGEIVQPLSIIINTSLCVGIFPELLKVAKVIPIYKAKDKELLNNYRPISLLQHKKFSMNVNMALGNTTRQIMQSMNFLIM